MPADRLLRILSRLARDAGGEDAKRLCEVSAEVTEMSGAGIMLLSGDLPQGIGVHDERDQRGDRGVAVHVG